MYNNNCLIILLLSIFYNLANAQQPFYKTIVYDKENNGIQLYTIMQDANGFIWLGTNKGLCRYDGNKCTYVKNSNEEVSTLVQEKNNDVWIGYSNGSIDVLKNGIIQKFNPEEGLPKVKITDITFDKAGRLWFSTYGEGIYCYEKGILYNINEDDGLSDNIVYKLLATLDDNIWVATDRGLSICNFTNKKKTIRIINDKQGLPDNIVRNIRTEPGTSTIWLTMQDKGVCAIDYKTKNIVQPAFSKQWTKGQVNDILHGNNSVYLATEEYGFLTFQKNAANNNVDLTQPALKQHALKLLQDNDANIWIVYNNVLQLSNANKFYTFQIPKAFQETIKAMSSDAAGNIWFANKKGLFTKKRNSVQIEKLSVPIKLETVVSLYADENNNIWIGTYDNGLYSYNTITKQTKHFNTNNGIIDNNIFTIAGTENEIWLGTFGGATKVNTANAAPSFENFTKANGLSNNYIYHINIDKDRNLWFSTDGSGLSVKKGNQFFNYDSIPGLESNIVYTSTQDIYGNIWFVGNNTGLLKFDGKKFSRYTEQEGLHDKNILNLIADNKGSLIITHPIGLEIFNIKEQQFSFYDKAYGFTDINTQLNAWCKLPNNNDILFATDSSIVYINANIDYTIRTKTILEQVNVLLKPIDFNSKHVFNYNENDISFRYVGLSYMNPEAVTYTYQLEGYTNDWIKTKDNAITFSNLPPGSYVFKVKSLVNKNTASANMVTYAFTIKKPFWRTIWFALLVLLTLGAIIYYFVWLRIKFVKIDQERKTEKLSNQLEVLKNQLNPHFLFNSFNTLLNVIDTKEKALAMEYTEKISDFYRSMVVVQDKDMITVQEELDILKNYMYLQQKRFGDNLSLILDVKKEHLEIGIPPLTLQLLAENAQKHNKVSAAKPLKISITSAQDYLIVSNNITLRAESITSTGIGLSNIIQRVKMLTNKDVNVIQDEKEFNVIVPLKL
jgi:ligand-binding sensor domain-containing protein